jgi:hypothetical protein
MEGIVVADAETILDKEFPVLDRGFPCLVDCPGRLRRPLRSLASTSPEAGDILNELEQ